MGLLKLYDEYPEIAKPIIIKTEALRVGVNYSGAVRQALKNVDISPKGYDCFSYDRSKPVLIHDQLPFSYTLKAYDCEVQTRLNENSDYTIDMVDGKFMFCEKGEPLEEVSFGWPAPKYYRRRLADGTPMASIVQANTATLFITLNKFCDFGRVNQSCLYCDMNSQTKSQKKGGESMVARKTLEQVSEVLRVAITEPRFRNVFITGGSILFPYKGKDELDFYCEHLHNIREALGGFWYPANFQIGALDDDGWKRVYETGVTCVQANMEVWDRRLFSLICPGKEKYVGYDEWIKCLIRGAEIFGPWRIVSNFVSGVEMARPFGFADVREAVNSTLKGFDMLMSYGIFPRTDVWVIEPGSALARTNPEPPPLEFYLRFNQGWLELREKYRPAMIPGMQSHNTYYIDTTCDWDYYHGTGPASKKREDLSLDAA